MWETAAVARDHAERLRLSYGLLVVETLELLEALLQEYTGTITQQLLHDPQLRNEELIRAALVRLGIGMTDPLGFSNNYAIGMRRQRAECDDARREF